MPAMLFIAGLLFLLATTTRSLLATYVGVVVYFVLQVVTGMLTRDVNNHMLAALLDPFGGRTLAIVTRYWSSDELNHVLPPLQGLLLFNRLLWGGIGLVLFGVAVALFRTDREGLQLPRRKPRAEPPMLRPAATYAAGSRRLTLDGGLRAHLQQLRAQWAFDTLAVLRGVPFLIMLILALVNVLAILALSGQLYGTATYPVTHRMLETVEGGFQVMLYIILTFYAGELVWRERSAGVAEVSDAFPAPDWVPLVAKLLALFAVVVAFLAVGTAVAIGWQLAHGYTQLEPGLYLATLALDTVPYLLLAVLAVFFQVLSNNKFLGYLLTIVLAGGEPDRLRPAALGHHLYNFGTAPATPYSDLNGFGHFLPAALWFDVYWACLGVAMMVVACAVLGARHRPVLARAPTRGARPLPQRRRASALAARRAGLCRQRRVDLLQHQRAEHLSQQRSRPTSSAPTTRSNTPNTTACAQPRITAVQCRCGHRPARAAPAPRGAHDADEPARCADPRAARQHRYRLHHHAGLRRRTTWCTTTPRSATRSTA